MVKSFLNFILAIYVVLSFIILINPNWIIENCNQTIADWVYKNYDTLYTVKVINFIFCLGTAYDVSSMESVGSSKSGFLWEKYATQNVFISQFLL